MSQRVKLICSNAACLNKSPVWRIFNALQSYICSGCGSHLKLYKMIRAEKQNAIAKAQLKEMGY